MRIKASQNPGMDIPNRENPMVSWSNQVLCITAEKTPKSTPNTSPIPIPKLAMRKVGSTRDNMASLTGMFRKIDWPRSPLAIRPSQAKNWVFKGWSNPSWLCRRRTCSSVAKSPRINRTGSPGVRWVMKNAHSATTPRTGIIKSIRLSRNFAMRFPLLPFQLPQPDPAFIRPAP